MYNPKSKRTSKQIGAVKKKTLDGLTANKNIDDIRALSKISNVQTQEIKNVSSELSSVSSSVSSKQNKLKLTTTGSSGPATLSNDILNVPDYSLGMGITIGTTAIASGTVGRVLFEGAGNVVQESANLFWDNTNSRLGIGTSSPAYGISHIGNIGVAAIFSQRDFGFGAYSQITQRASYIAYTTDGTTGLAIGAASGAARIQGFNGLPATSDKPIFLQSLGGNVGIGTTTDAGYKLDVNGTARLNNNLILTNSSFTGTMSIRVTANNTITFGNSGIGDWLQAGSTNRVFILQELNSTARGNVLGNNIGTIAVNISTLSPQSSGTSNLTGLQLTYAINNTGTYSGIARGIFYNPTLTSLTGTIHRAIETVTGDVLFCTTSGNVGIGTASPTNKLDISFIANRLISFTQRPGYADYGRIVFSNVTGADIASSGNISLIPGDANEIISFGSFLTRSAFTASSNYGTYSPTGVGFQVHSNKPFVFRNISTDINTDFFVFEASNTGARRLFNIIQNSVSYLTVFPTGNVTIGTTTDAGYKLDVNGTARVQGQTFIQSSSGSVALIADFANTNSRIQIESHGSTDFTQIKIGNNFSLSRNGGSNPSISTTQNFDFKTPQINFSSLGNAPSRIFINGNYGLGSAYFGANNSNGTTASILYFQNSVTPLAAQNVIATFNLWGISDDATVPSIPASSMFSLQSTTRGFLPPRMTNAQMVAIATPAEGLVVYDTTNRKLCCYDGATWQNLF